MSRVVHTGPLELLRAKADEERSQAVFADDRADEAWSTYKRHSERSREAWDRHGALLAAIHALEKAEA